jgi:hypothetical protein
VRLSPFLVLVGAGLILYSWFQPWWQAYVVELQLSPVTIYPYNMEIIKGDYPEWFIGFDNAMPAWFFAFMWAYLGLSLVALLVSLLVSDKKIMRLGPLTWPLPQVLIAIVGLSYILIVAAAVVTIAIRSGDFYDAPLMGSVFVSIPGEIPYESWVDTDLKFGYWLACAAGPFLVILALLRNKIIGKSRIEV